MWALCPCFLRVVCVPCGVPFLAVEPWAAGDSPAFPFTTHPPRYSLEL
jgi:hypothetical protein